MSVTIATGAVILAAGCGGDNETRVRPSEVERAPATERPAPRPSPPPADHEAEAKKFVRDYYRMLNGREFEGAWSLLSVSLQARLGPFERWKSGYELTEGTRARISRVSADEAGARLEVTLNSDDLDVCGDHAPQTFEGQWELSRSGGNWTVTEIRFDKVIGGEPVRDPAECLDTWTVVEPPEEYTPPAAGFTYVPDPGPGEPLYDPSPSFCDVHDCIPNFYEGTGYPVQCRDGSWSNSGGRPGVCSWHGGPGGY